MRARRRAMARVPGQDRFNLSPRARRLAGWAAMIALLGGVALGVRFVGGTGDGGPEVGASPSGGAPIAAIAFGTALDPVTGLVTTVSRTTRFEAGDTFAYSVSGVAPETVVFVEVERTGGGAMEVVQLSSAQSLGPTAAAIAFTVAADALFDAWGPGEYRMRIATELAGEPVAEGSFELIGPAQPPAP